MKNFSKHYQKRIAELKAENALLKAEVERLTQRLGGVRLIVTEEMYDELNTKYLEQQHELHNIPLTARQILDEKIDLKAEVERLTAFTTRTIIPNEELQAQVERLTKESADWQESYHIVNERMSALLKEGKQP